MKHFIVIIEWCTMLQAASTSSATTRKSGASILKVSLTQAIIIVHFCKWWKHFFIRALVSGLHEMHYKNQLVDINQFEYLCLASSFIAFITLSYFLKHSIASTDGTYILSSICLSLIFFKKSSISIESWIKSQDYCDF